MTPTRTITPGGPILTPTWSVTPGGPASTGTNTPVSCPIAFSDVRSTDWFYEWTVCLYCRGAISGYTDGTFKPDLNTTRGQMAKIAVIGFGITPYSPPPGTASTPTFLDVPVTNPFYSYVEAAARQAIVTGYVDGTFRLSNNVTRAQLSKIVVVAANHVYGWKILNPNTPTFSDVPREDPFYTFIETAVCHGIISGYSDGGFHPDSEATRAQIAKIVCQAVRNAKPCGQ